MKVNKCIKQKSCGLFAMTFAANFKFNFIENKHKVSTPRVEIKESFEAMKLYKEMLTFYTKYRKVWNQTIKHKDHIARMDEDASIEKYISEETWSLIEFIRHPNKCFLSNQITKVLSGFNFTQGRPILQQFQPNILLSVWDIDTSFSSSNFFEVFLLQLQMNMTIKM